MESTAPDRTFRLVLYDALASEAMSTLTAGVFLTGFLVELGASNLAIGLLAAVPFTVQFLQLPAVVLVERLRARRTIATWAAGIGRSFLLAAAAAPFLGADAGIITLVVCVACYQAMAAIAGCAWNSWMRDLVPEGAYGRFFGRRATATTALATALALLGGVLIDRWKRRDAGTSRVRLCGPVHRKCCRSAFLASGCCRSRPTSRCHRSSSARALSTLAGDTVPRQEFPPIDGVSVVLEFCRQPRCPVLCRLYAQDAGLLDDDRHRPDDRKPAQQPGGARALGQPHRSFQQQGRTRNLGATVPCLHIGLDLHRPCLGGAATLYLLLVIHVLMGIATAGVALASGNIVMKLSPAGQATAFLATSSVVSATCAAMAPVIGGLCADFFAAHRAYARLHLAGQR